MKHALALEQNHAIATNLGLSRYNLDSLVQPDVSGLYSGVFQQAAYDFGIRYLISDASQPRCGEIPASTPASTARTSRPC